MANALYTQVYNDIISLSNRPDLASETAISLRKATLKFHLAGTFKRDVVDSIIATPTPDPSYPNDLRYSIDTNQLALLTFFRRMLSIYEWTIPLTGSEREFIQYEPNDVLDGYKAERRNYWFQAGTIIQLRTDRPPALLKLKYLRLPDINPNTYTSWIATVFSDVIVEEALVGIFKAIGKDEESKAMAENFQDNLHMIEMIDY